MLVAAEQPLAIHVEVYGVVERSERGIDVHAVVHDVAHDVVSHSVQQANDSFKQNLPPHTYIMFDIRNNNHQHVLHYHIDLLNNTCCEYIVVSGILI